MNCLTMLRADAINISEEEIMIVFFNTFISYLIIVLVSFGLIVLAVILGKKLRDNKDEKDALKAEDSANIDNSGE